jgi:hypothetical protein
MGYNRDHAIVVTGGDHLEAAREAAIEAGCMLVSEIVGPGINGQRSFFVAPDGSKEWWDTSNKQDEARDRFVSWLRGSSTASSNAPAWDWVEVQFGDDDHETLIVRDSDHEGAF